MVKAINKNIYNIYVNWYLNDANERWWLWQHRIYRFTSVSLYRNQIGKRANRTSERTKQKKKLHLIDLANLCAHVSVCVVCMWAYLVCVDLVSHLCTLEFRADHERENRERSNWSNERNGANHINGIDCYGNGKKSHFLFHFALTKCGFFFGNFARTIFLCVCVRALVKKRNRENCIA